MLYLIFSVLLGSIPVNRDYQPLEEGIEIWVERDALHTEIIVPTQTETINWLNYLQIEEEQQYIFRYVSFGWGEKRWYLSGGQLTLRAFPAILNALFLPSESVMHVNTIQVEPFPARHRVKIFVSPEQLDLLNQYIFNYFTVQKEENIFDLVTDEQIGGYGKFYAARGKYHVFSNSNHWTNRIIKRMGIRSPLWAPFPHAIMSHLRRAHEPE